MMSFGDVLDGLTMPYLPYWRNRVGLSEGIATDEHMELIGGVEKRTIAVVEYDAAWPHYFGVQRERIDHALADVPHRVVHVGSTAVTGLSAKPIVDLQLSVSDVEDEGSYLPLLESAGYVLRVRKRGHRMLRTAALDVHVHVCSIGSDWERRHLLFRDWLRESEADRAAYAEVKEVLAREDWPSMNHYADAKSRVIQEITAHAERWATTTGWSQANSPSN
jgi:GrpB-like predicted nucleotidyltransferase (UPF0157 family)